MLLEAHFFLLGVLILVFREDWRVGAALTAFSILAFLVFNLTRNIAVPIYTAERESYARLYGFIEERLLGLEDIRTNGAGDYTVNRFYNVNNGVFARVKKSEFMSEGLRAITGIMFALGYALAMGMGIWLYREGTFTIGAVFLVFHYTSMLREPLFQISQQINDLQRATAGLKRIEELHRIQTNILDGKEKLSVPSGKLEVMPLGIAFENVHFAYNPGDPVLRNISFFLDPGKTLGLLGRTGSGKTTITRLLFRFYDIQRGQIRIGDQNIRDILLDDLRQHVGLVTQDVQLFNASVRDNLTLFRPGVSDKKNCCHTRRSRPRYVVCVITRGVGYRTRLGQSLGWRSAVARLCPRFSQGSQSGHFGRAFIAARSRNRAEYQFGSGTPVAESHGYYYRASP